MWRQLSSAFLAATLCTSASAQSTTAPPIAYAKLAGSAQEIYLVNQDGSGSKKIYSSGNKKSIGAIDLKPGGGQIAWTEFGNGVAQLKVLTLDSAGNPVGQPQVLPGLCHPNSVDHHPTSSVLLISEICNETSRIATINSDGSGYNVLRSLVGYLDQPRWLHDGTSYVYVSGSADFARVYVCRNDCDPAANDRLLDVVTLGRIDVARTKNFLVYEGSNSNISELNIDTGALRPNFVRGTDPHYSPTDRYVLYETPHEAKGDYLMIYDNNSNSSARLSAKGEYTGRDWRPN